MQRRDFLRNLTLAVGASALPVRRVFAAERLAPDAAQSIHTRLAALEKQHGGRLGVAMLDTGSGLKVGYRSGHRFMMCSTHKVLTVAATLARVADGVERLDQRVVFDNSVLLDYAPITRQHVGPPGMTIDALCEAAITLSDNTADNLLIARLGGPKAVTAYARSLGDQVTCLARTEPALNYAVPDDPRGTSTPDAMLQDLHALLLGDALPASGRQHLRQWMHDCKTGNALLRAGLAHGWACADKTGSGPANELNDVALLTPPNGKPLLVTAFYAGSVAAKPAREHVLAEVGRLAVALHTRT